jgi:hypothetical protein
LALNNLKLALEIANAELKKLDVFETLLVLEFTLGEGRLQDLDFLVE